MVPVWVDPVWVDVDANNHTPGFYADRALLSAMRAILSHRTNSGVNRRCRTGS